MTLTDERIKEEFRKAKLTIPTGMAVNMVMMDSVYENFSATIRTGERLGKIEGLEELIEHIHAEHQTPSSIVSHLSRRINELKDAQS